MIEEFERHLRGTNLSENTISSYLFALRQYSSQYDGITKKNLRAYKVWLIENYKPKTVNLRLRAINCYLESIGKESWKMPFVRVQQKAFLENVISEADYEYFKTCLKRDDEHGSVSSYRSRWNTSSWGIWTYIRRAVNSDEYTYPRLCKMKPFLG